MAPNTKNIKMISRWLVRFAIAGMVAASGSLAADSGREGAEIHTITPLTELGIHQATVQAEHFFDIVGALNLIEKDRIVVGNSELKPASGLKTSHVELSNIVGVKLNGSGEVVRMEAIYNDLR